MKIPRTADVRPAPVALMACGLIFVVAQAFPMDEGKPGRIHGAITGSLSSSIASVTGIEIILDSHTDGSRRSVRSGTDGRYAFDDLISGLYTVTVLGRRGHQQKTEVVVEDGSDIQLDFTATHFEGAISITAMRAARPVEEVAAGVSVIGKETIENTPMRNLGESLGGAPGVLVGTKNQGYDARLMIRGAGLKARYAVREIMILLDGVPLTDPDSLTRLDFVDPHLIDRIEVVRGPNSTLWGVNTTGGVVNVITKSPWAMAGSKARIDIGSEGARHFHVLHSDTVGRHAAYALNISRRESKNSWRPHNLFDTTQVTLQPSISIGGGALLSGIFSFTDASIELPGRLIVNREAGIDQWRPFQERGLVEETAEPWKHGGRQSRILFLASSLEAQLGRLRLNPKIYANIWTHRHPVTGKINRADSVDVGFDLQGQYRHAFGEAIGGVSLRSNRQTAEAFTYADVATSMSGRILSTLSDAAGELMRRVDRRIVLSGLYLQESYRPGPGWIIDLGLRYDRISFDAQGMESAAYDYAAGRYVEGEGTIDRSSRFEAWSPRLGVVRRFGPTVNAYAAVAKGVQTPTADELRLNPDLSVTRVANYELGLKGHGRTFGFDLAVFHCPVSDEVIQVRKGHGESGYVNAGRTEKTGVEISVDYRPRIDWNFGGSYTYSDFEFRRFSEPVRGLDVDRSGNHLPFIPRHQYSAFAQWSGSSGFHVRVSTASWGTSFLDNANSETTRGYDLVSDVTFGYETERYALTLLVRNLLDQRYAVEAQKDLYGSYRYSPAAPRVVFGRISWTF